MRSTILLAPTFQLMLSGEWLSRAPNTPSSAPQKARNHAASAERESCDDKSGGSTNLKVIVTTV